MTLLKCRHHPTINLKIQNLKKKQKINTIYSNLMLTSLFNMNNNESIIFNGLKK
jgi:hypothetical protein